MRDCCILGLTSSRASAATSSSRRDEEGLALGGGEVLEDVGDVGGVHLREAVLLDLEADAAGGVALDEVDEVPGDDAGAEAGGDAVRRWSLAGP